MEKTLDERLQELNIWLFRWRPGYYVVATEVGPLLWQLFGPDGSVLYTKDHFDDIESVAHFKTDLTDDEAGSVQNFDSLYLT